MRQLTSARTGEVAEQMDRQYRTALALNALTQGVELQMTDARLFTELYKDSNPNLCSVDPLHALNYSDGAKFPVPIIGFGVNVLKEGKVLGDNCWSTAGQSNCVIDTLPLLTEGVYEHDRKSKYYQQLKPRQYDLDEMPEKDQVFIKDMFVATNKSIWGGEYNLAWNCSSNPLQIFKYNLIIPRGVIDLGADGWTLNPFIERRDIDDAGQYLISTGFGDKVSVLKTTLQKTCMDGQPFYPNNDVIRLEHQHGINSEVITPTLGILINKLKDNVSTSLTKEFVREVDKIDDGYKPSLFLINLLSANLKI